MKAATLANKIKGSARPTPTPIPILLSLPRDFVMGTEVEVRVGDIVLIMPEGIEVGVTEALPMLGKPASW